MRDVREGVSEGRDSREGRRRGAGERACVHRLRIVRGRVHRVVDGS